MATKDSVLFRFREKDSREGITRSTLKQLADALDLSETAAMHRALVEYARQHVPQYARDDGPLSATDHRKIAEIVRKTHGVATITESLFDDSARGETEHAPRRIPTSRRR
ncbi:MAG: hypothetical protein NDI88_06350 [Lysobacter sp.]|nr:hypothetical protein [Lysobacter sp.]